MNQTVEIDEFHEDLGDDIDSPLDCASALRDRLEYSKTGELMLAIVWASDKS